MMLDFAQVKFFVKVFLKVLHGWTAKYKVDNDEEAVKKAEEAHQDSINVS